MSGIEVVGMVLASFPLLISALEHSHRAAEVRDDWWQVKREYKKCKQELQCAELALENNLERFLLPLIVDDDEIKGLISEPGGSKWAEPALEVNLRSLLPKSYDLFVETVNEIKNVMDRLQAELGIANKPFMKLVEDNSLSKGHSTNKKISESVKDWITKPKVDFWSRGREKLVSKSELQTQRVRFALGRTTRAKLFQDLEKYNVRLRDLLDTNDRSAGYKKSRIILKKSMVSETLWRFWRNAKSLYILLTQAFCCSCKQYHLAQLLLRHQTDVGQAEFQIRLLYSAEDSISSELWALKEVIIKRVNNDDIKDKQIIVPKTPRKTSSPNLLLRPALRGHDQSLGTTSENRPKVKWAALSESTLSGGIPPQDRGSAAITDLCHAIATSSPSTQCLGLLENSDDHYSLHQMPEQQQRDTLPHTRQGHGN
ncbi:hypothetical protein GJ744_008424 [Endocarpon pusillum]|uniref:Prion-inhibition and propagation HeLo domain-containing protein n=1 Tax=Endocarpon pusillum TaxID=364733 RepID=A0A8H7AKE6_9EURO|nr:hypothetical protein GJ744_008424 [Endocarpon pusillum]